MPMLINEANFLVIDFEATCSDDRNFPRDEMEIIEIGAVLQDRDSLEIVSEFQTFVRPVRHPELTPFCRELTSIQQSDVDSAPRFQEAASSLRQWLPDIPSYRFCSWGNYDRNQLRQDCQFHNVAYPFDAGHTNLKAELASLLGIRKPLGIGGMLKRLGLSFEGTPHRGIDDVRNIVRHVCGVGPGQGPR